MGFRNDRSESANRLAIARTIAQLTLPTLAWKMRAAMVLSVVIPVYNELQTLKEIVRRVASVPLDKELVLVDDCSTDGSRDILKEIAEKGLGSAVPQAEIRGQTSARVVFQEKNGGKGAALRRGFQEATGDIVIVQDADLEYDPQEMPRIIQPILDGHADVVFGSRFTGSERRVLYFWHSFANWGLTLLSNVFTDLNLTDMETCYKAFRREVIQSIVLEEDRFGFEPEITAKVAKKKLRIYEVPISYHGRTYAEGKKIGMKDGFRALYAIVKYGVRR
jgi:glycosyltransferase involved in cell wall biosynthesis